jgi:hypothetical protein
LSCPSAGHRRCGKPTKESTVRTKRIETTDLVKTDQELRSEGYVVSFYDGRSRMYTHRDQNKPNITVIEVKQ